ncbi:MAG: hypothetical protein M9894_22430 [Planctomycetes bacterium]|nr:hypothetical protein [Planctomycetota bacterium]
MVEVLPPERGRLYALLPSGPLGGPLALAPGAELDVRLVVDAGPGDGDSATLDDVLGAYDLRLLVDPRALEVVAVRGGTSPLGAPLIVQLADEPGGVTSLRLQDLNDTGTLASPAGPDPGATGILEVAVVTLRVREGAPGGPAAIGVAVDLLATARSAEPACVEALGAATPRLGTVVGAVSVAVPAWALRCACSAPHRARATRSWAPCPSLPPARTRRSRSCSAGPSTWPRSTAASPCKTRAGPRSRPWSTPARRPSSARLVPGASLPPGTYQVRLGASTRDLAGGDLGSEVSFGFRVGPVPAPLSHDLDQDGEVTLADFLIRRPGDARARRGRAGRACRGCARPRGRPNRFSRHVMRCDKVPHIGRPVPALEHGRPGSSLAAASRRGPGRERRVPTGSTTNRTRPLPVALDAAQRYNVPPRVALKATLRCAAPPAATTNAGCPDRSPPRRCRRGAVRTHPTGLRSART